MTAKRRQETASKDATRGRPTRFRPEFVDIAAALAKNGGTDADIAYALNVSIKTISRWQAEHAEFCQALVVPPGAPDDRAERALFQRALGFEMQEAHPIKLREVKYEDGKKVSESERVEIVEVTKTLPPETTAAVKWLTNRRPDRWRERQMHELTGKNGTALIPEPASPRHLARAVLDIIREATLAPGTPADENGVAHEPHELMEAARRSTMTSRQTPPMNALVRTRHRRRHASARTILRAATAPTISVS